MPPIRYRSAEEDSARWRDFPLRPGDVVISSRSKHGTTWMQMIVALLVFRTPRLPAPLAALSPWLDWLVVPPGETYARLAAQRHRRFVKTHTPLDGLPLDPHVTYVVVARHPLDAAVSLWHQSANLDRERIRQLTGAPTAGRPVHQPLHDWLTAWIERTVDPADALDSLPGVLHHLSDAWSRREAANVLLVHYADLQTDLAGQMRRVAAALGITVDPGTWPGLVEAATFAAMRSRSAELAPDPVGVLKDPDAFFRSGRSGSWRPVLSTAEHQRYLRRAAGLAPADLRDWLHRPD